MRAKYFITKQITEDDDYNDDYNDVDKLAEQYYQHLIDALFQERYHRAWDLVQKINTECYEQIGDILWRISVEAPDDQFREFLTLHKDQFLYDLLYSIKDSNYVNVREIFKVFKRTKLDWPELDAIENSLRAEGVITEHNEELEPENEDIKHHLLEALIDTINHGYWEIFIYTYYTLREHASQATIIEECRSATWHNSRKTVIKLILRLLKHNEFECAYVLYAACRKHKLQWPELEAIEKSLRADGVITEDENLVESARSDFIKELNYSLHRYDNPEEFRYSYNALSRWYSEAEKIRIIHQGLNPIQNKNSYIKFILKMIKEGSEYQEAVVGLITAIRMNNVDWPELDAIEKSLRAQGIIRESKESRECQRIFNRLVVSIRDNSIFVFSFYYDGMLRLGYPEDDLIADIAEQVANFDKDHWIRFILTFMKRDLNTPYTQKIIQAIRMTNVDWPELDTIENSLRAHGVIKEDDDETETIKSDPQAREDLYNYFLYFLENYGWKVFLTKITSFVGVNFDKFPELQQPFVEHKDEIIKDCLELMKQSYYEDVSDYVSKLKHLGFDWKELDIIQRSLDAENITHMNETNDLGNKYDHNILHLLGINWCDSPTATHRFVAQYWLLQEDGYLAKEINDAIEQYIREDIECSEQDLLKFLFGLIKDYCSNPATIAYFQVIRKIFPDWPELDAVEKSFRADKLINEQVTSTEQESHNRVINSFTRIDDTTSMDQIDEDLSYLVYHCKLYPNTYRNPREIKGLLNSKRQFIIRAILHQIKRILQRISYQKLIRRAFELIDEIISCLLNFVDWPELDEILDSMENITGIEEVRLHGSNMILTEMFDLNEHLNELSEEEQIAMVKQTGLVIKYIKNPSEAVQLAAVQEYGSAIQYITNPSAAVQLAAVKQDGRAIQYIENPSEAVQLAAVQEYGFAIKYIRNPSEDLQLIAVQKDGRAIGFIQPKSKNKQVILTAFLKQLKRVRFEFQYDTYYGYKRLYPDWTEWKIIDKALKDLA